MFLDDIGNHLITEGVVEGSTGWKLFQGFMPPDQDKVVVIFETPGEEPDIVRDSSNGEKSYDHPGLQVRVRGTRDGYEEARIKMQEAFNALHHNEPVQASSEPAFIYIYAVGSGPLPLGQDKNGRPELVWNFRTMREREVLSGGGPPAPP